MTDPERKLSEAYVHSKIKEVTQKWLGKHAFNVIGQSYLKNFDGRFTKKELQQAYLDGWYACIQYNEEQTNNLLIDFLMDKDISGLTKEELKQYLEPMLFLKRTKQD